MSILTFNNDLRCSLHSSGLEGRGLAPGVLFRYPLMHESYAFKS